MSRIAYGRMVLVVLIGLMLAACEVPGPEAEPSPTPGTASEPVREPVATEAPPPRSSHHPTRPDRQQRRTENLFLPAPHDD
jgi:hypothetical protein